jgi:hypothetical protein
VLPARATFEGLLKYFCTTSRIQDMFHDEPPGKSRNALYNVQYLPKEYVACRVFRKRRTIRLIVHIAYDILRSLPDFPVPGGPTRDQSKRQEREHDAFSLCLCFGQTPCADALFWLDPVGPSICIVLERKRLMCQRLVPAVPETSLIRCLASHSAHVDNLK